MPNPFRRIQRWHSLQSLVRALSPMQLVPLAAGIGALFAILGPMTDIMGGARQPGLVLLIGTLVAVFTSLGLAFGSMRRNYPLLAVTLAVQAAWVLSVSRGSLFDGLAVVPPDRIADRMRLDAFTTLTLVVLSYSCFLWFINRTAAQYLHAQAEILLAREIHRVLVPAVSATIDGFEFAGCSVPSGEVGGDLVDVVDRDEGWIGYVADVSGHGVSSGLVMGMFKSALHTRLLAGGSLTALLQDLNTVLVPLKQSSMFVTLAAVRVMRGGPVEFAVAGHLPILRVRAGATAVEEITTPQIPIGMFDDYRFVASALDCAPGDLLALVTDGLTEVFDPADRELGLDGVKKVLAASATQPLDEIGRRLLAASRAHGPQLDDQTFLLIRRS